MASLIKKTIKEITPPIALKIYKRFFNNSAVTWSGNYSSWEEAQSISTGYDANNILEKVKNALLKVKNGEAVYERDSFLFDKVEYSWPLLSALMWVASQNNGSLKVLDFGGSLGSTYFQNKAFVEGLKELHWGIVEQENFVTCGKKHFENEQLKFFYDVKSCITEISPEVAIFSGVLQCIESPYKLLTEIVDILPKFLVIDLMPFLSKGEDRITLQRISPVIYDASYPCWFLNRRNFIRFFESHYEMIADFDNSLSIFLDGEKVQYQGFIFRRK